MARSVIVAAMASQFTLPRLTTSLRQRPSQIVKRTARPFPSCWIFKNENILSIAPSDFDPRSNSN